MLYGTHYIGGSLPNFRTILLIMVFAVSVVSVQAKLTPAKAYSHTMQSEFGTQPQVAVNCYDMVLNFGCRSTFSLVSFLDD